MKPDRVMLSAQDRVALLRKNLRAPFRLKKTPQFRLARTVKEAMRYVDRGFVPIECSAGESAMDGFFNLDHHGKYAHLDGVALRGYEDFYGYLVGDPRVVFIGFPDEDACFAAASLLALVPHPVLEDVFPEVKGIQALIIKQNLMHFAEKINEVDLNPEKALELVDTRHGQLILLWRMLAHSTMDDILAWWGGVNRWRELLTRDVSTAVSMAPQLHHDMLDRVLEVRAVNVGDFVSVADFTEFGPNSAYYRHYTQAKTPLLVAFFQDRGVCSFVVRDLPTSQRMFGKRGLLEVYAKLQPTGCGGREILGGSPRDVRITEWERALEFGRQLSAAILPSFQ